MVNTNNNRQPHRGGYRHGHNPNHRNGQRQPRISDSIGGLIQTMYNKLPIPTIDMSYHQFIMRIVLDTRSIINKIKNKEASFEALSIFTIDRFTTTFNLQEAIKIRVRCQKLIKLYHIPLDANYSR